MQLTVKTLTGAVATLEPSPDTTIDELKESVSSKLAIPRPRQKIFYAGKQLLDGTLREAGMLDGDFVVVMAAHAAAPSPMEISASGTATTTGASLSLRKSGTAPSLRSSAGNVPMPATPSKPAATPVSPSPTTISRNGANNVADAADSLKSHFQSLLSTLRAVPPSPPLPNPSGGGLLAPLVGSAASPSSPPASLPATPSPNAANTSVEEPHVDAFAVQQLVDMGFTQNRAKKALILNRMNFSVATNWLLEHNDDADIDAPLTADQLRPLVRMGSSAGGGGGAGSPSLSGNAIAQIGNSAAGSKASVASSSASSSSSSSASSLAPAAGGGGGSSGDQILSKSGNGSSATAPAPAASASASSQQQEEEEQPAEEDEDDDGVVQPNAVLRGRLQEMGFGVEDINNALRNTNNNYEAACAWLLGDRDEAVEDADEDPNDDANDNGLGGLDESNPIVAAILNNPAIQRGMTPRVVAAFQNIFQNPASAAQYANDPEIAPLILQVHNILSAHKDASSNPSNANSNSSNNNANASNSNNNQPKNNDDDASGDESDDPTGLHLFD